MIIYKIRFSCDKIMVKRMASGIARYTWPVDWP